MRKSTPAQIAASRRNGARSRGPLSEATRAKVARNALKHGLTASTTVLDSENRDRFDELLSDLLADLAPQTTLEFCAVEEMAAAKWKQRRAWQLETTALNSAQAEADHPSAHGRSLQAWRKLHRRAERDFASLLHLEHRLDRQYDRAFTRFLKLEEQRQAEQTNTTSQENENGKFEPENA